MATNSPRSMARLTSWSTGGPSKPLVTLVISRKAMGSDRLEPPFEDAHQPVEGEADEADDDDRENDVLVDEGVVFLPEETAGAGPAGEHLGGDDGQPGDAERQPETREHVGQGCRDQDSRESL